MTTASPRSRGVCRHFACSSQQASRRHCHRCHAAHGSFQEGLADAAAGGRALRADLAMSVPHHTAVSDGVCCECKREDAQEVYKSWLCGAGFYARMVFTCGVVFFHLL